MAMTPGSPISALDSPPEGAIRETSRPWTSVLVPCALYVGTRKGQIAFGMGFLAPGSAELDLARRRYPLLIHD